jgi:hypothetical protein
MTRGFRESSSAVGKGARHLECLSLQLFPEDAGVVQERAEIQVGKFVRINLVRRQIVPTS